MEEGWVQIEDNVIWVSHIRDNDALVSRIHNMNENEIIALEVDWFRGFWCKMKSGKDGRPTSGLKPLEDANKHWKSAQRRKGEAVPIREVTDW